MSPYLRSTRYLDWEHPLVSGFVAETTAGVADPREKAVRLYRRVRDEIRYEPYRVSLDDEAMTASATLARGDGFCVAKAVLLAAVGRAAGIHTRLGFADVRNHLATDKLLRALGTDLFVWHGYTELWLEGRWVKATPAFNLSLCEKFGVRPLEFDGLTDSLFHPYDRWGRLHMEYVRPRGTYPDLPLARLRREYRRYYPAWTMAIEGDFAQDAAPKQQEGS